MSALRFFAIGIKNRSKRYEACSDVELLARFELAATACGGLRFFIKTGFACEVASSKGYPVT